MTETHAPLVKFIEAFNQGDLAGMSEPFDPSFVFHSVPKEKDRNLSEFIAQCQEFRRAFSGARCILLDDLATAEGGVIRFLFDGKFHHEFRGLPPTGRHVQIDAILIARLRDGLISEAWEFYDALETERQLGGPAALRKSMVEQLHYELFSAKRFALLDTLVTGDFRMHSPYFTEVLGKDELRATIENLHRVLADPKYRIVSLTAEGDRVTVHYIATGRHTGEFFGVPATNRSLTLAGMSVITFREEKIAVIENLWDALGLLEQIGGWTPSAESNKRLARRFFDEFLNAGRHDIAPEIFANDVAWHASHMPPLRGPEAVREWARLSRTDWPDLHYELVDLLAERDEVVCHWKWSGTHQARWMGVEPTGKRLEFSGTTILKFRDGKICGHWAEWDTLRTLQFLGAAPDDAKLVLVRSKA